MQAFFIYYHNFMYVFTIMQSAQYNSDVRFKDNKPSKYIQCYKVGMIVYLPNNKCYSDVTN